jgi:hypothetical protein
MPFSEFQLDTKHLLDKNTLPKEVYEHIKDYNLPLYEWNLEAYPENWTIV